MKELVYAHTGRGSKTFSQNGGCLSDWHGLFCISLQYMICISLKVLYYLFIKYISKYLKHYSNIGIYYFQNSSRF